MSLAVGLEMFMNVSLFVNRSTMFVEVVLHWSLSRRLVSPMYCL